MHMQIDKNIQITKISKNLLILTSKKSFCTLLKSNSAKAEEK